MSHINAQENNLSRMWRVLKTFRILRILQEQKIKKFKNKKLTHPQFLIIQRVIVESDLPFHPRLLSANGQYFYRYRDIEWILVVKLLQYFAVKSKIAEKLFIKICRVFKYFYCPISPSLNV